ncbi:MAG: glutamine-hydrolyzing GMP synthase [Bacillota bacterium]
MRGRASVTDEEKVLILDFGAQYSQLIARRVRECGVYSEIVPGDLAADRVRDETPGGLILSGGPGSVYSEDAPWPDPGVFSLGVPVLGICYGHQLVAGHFGGPDCVRSARSAEYGRSRVSVREEGQLLAGLPAEFDAWMSHGDMVQRLPPGFTCLASTRDAPVAAMADPERGVYGVQFHPEVHHTPVGRQILENWLYRICNFRGGWSMSSFVDTAVEGIRKQVGDGRAICGLSGGVDSSVAATLVHRAIGDRLTCVFVDHGLLRAGERDLVEQMFRDQMNMNVVSVDAGERFLGALAGVTDPEEKRRIVGREFIRVFEEEASARGGYQFLVQGTIYPDVVESGTDSSAVIKSHHNVGGLPEHMDMELVEPLRDLFKDEVRLVGEELGLPEEILSRHPFPGPGLAVRVLGEVTPQKVSLARGADAIFTEEIREAGLYRKVWQAFAVLSDGRSVGVMGDGRTYGRTVILRAVTSEDAMTADWARIPPDVLDRTARRIVNEIREINRVAYDITSKPPGTIEWE